METLINLCKPHETKPISDKLKIWRQNYYEMNKEKIKQRARQASKEKYHNNPEHKEKVKQKNATYRLVVATAKEIVLKHQEELLNKEINNNSNI